MNRADQLGGTSTLGARGARGAKSGRNKTSPTRRIVVVLSGLVGLAVFAAGCSGQSTSTTTGTTGTTAPPETTTLPEVPIEEGKQIFAYVPEVGDCFDKRQVAGVNGNKKQEIVLKLDCAKPHENEVFALVDPPKPADPKDTSYPGDEVLRKFAKVECPKQFDPYVGKLYELSKLEIGYIMPGKATWPSNRKIACYVFDSINHRVAGSLKGKAS